MKGYITFITWIILVGLAASSWAAGSYGEREVERLEAEKIELQQEIEELKGTALKCDDDGVCF